MTHMMILDGNSLINRAFYALPPFTSAEGLPTNAVHGFLTMLFRLQRDHKPDYWAVTFDKSKPTVRIEQYTAYKAQRKETPEALRPQFDYLKEILQVLAVPILELDGFEADDIIATVTDRAVRAGMQVSIYSGDRDALQLVSPSTTVYFTKRGITDVECYDEQKLMEKYNLKPSQIIDLKGLMGDVSDNIPGIPGVGEKTALKLLLEYGTVENVLENKHKVSGVKLRASLTDYAEQALLSKRLATMISDVPIEFELEDLKWREPNRDECKKILHRYSLNTVARLFEQSLDIRLGNNKTSKTSAGTEGEQVSIYPAYDGPQETILDGHSWLEKMHSWLEKKPTLALSYRYEGQSIHHGQWTEIGIYDGQSTFCLSRNTQAASVINRLYEVLEDEGVRKLLADSKSFYYLLLNEGKTLNGVDLDLSLAAYLLNPNRSNYHAAELLRDFTSDLFSLSPAQEAYLLYKLGTGYVENLAKEGLEKLLYEIEQPLSKVLAQMEKNGISLDGELLHNFELELEEKINGLEQEICGLAGSKFNLNSPQQLGKVLFEDLGLPPMKKTKTGYSTDAETLEELRGEHPIIELILEYRQLTKLYSTYVKSLTAQAYQGKIHTTFQQTVTATGRLSSTDPNLQNIPIRLAEGRKLRKVFKPSQADWLLFSADYSQIELRILAHYSRDPILCESFINGEDVHTRTASEVFGVPLAEVTPDMRYKAKAVNFGLMYGLTDFGLSRDLSIPRKEAKYYITQYFEKYSGVQEYLDKAVRIAKEQGEVRTLYNRLRKVPELSHPNRMTRQFGERIAKNTPIQGSAADIMKIAMLRVSEALQGYQARILLQVHDELLLEVSREHLSPVAMRVKQAMETCCSLIVPLVVECKAGENWFEMTDYILS